MKNPDREQLPRITARIVDPDTVRLVKEGVLAGFSIGGKYIERNAKDPSIIEKIKLTEISLVDSPANKDCRIELVKRRVLLFNDLLKGEDDEEDDADTSVDAVMSAGRSAMPGRDGRAGRDGDGDGVFGEGNGVDQYGPPKCNS